MAPFSRGYAPSAVAADGDYSVSALVRDAVDLHQELGGDRRACVIGHDWGAVTAYAASARRPEAFGRVVGLAVPPVPGLLRATDPRTGRRGGRAVVEQLPRSWYVLVNQLPVLSERLAPRMVPRLWRAWSPGYDATADLRWVREALDGRWSAALRYYRAAARALLARHPPDWVRSPTVPTLYLHGARDGCVSPLLATSAAQTLPAGSSFQVLPELGHFLHLERPADLARRILAFVGQG